jgi:hypothetical protein
MLPDNYRFSTRCVAGEQGREYVGSEGRAEVKLMCWELIAAVGVRTEQFEQMPQVPLRQPQNQAQVVL